MSKEKIIGLSVLGVLATSMAGVGAWRFLGDHGPVQDQGVAAVETDNAEETDQKTKPTVLASATGSGNSELADRLAGKTKNSSSWNTASKASNTVEQSPPALPTGSADYRTANSDSNPLRSSATDQERHRSYMPKETAADTNLNVEVEETAAGRYGSSAQLTSEPVTDSNLPNATELPASSGVEESLPGEALPSASDPSAQTLEPSNADQSLAQDSTNPYSASNQSSPDNIESIGEATSDSYNQMSSRVPSETAAGEALAEETIQIVESAPVAVTPETNAIDTAAEQLARRAEDEARFAEAYSRVEEAVQIPAGAVETQSVPDLSQPMETVASQPNTTHPSYDPVNTEPTPPARFKADSRFAADARYVSEGATERTSNPSSLAASTVPVAEQTNNTPGVPIAGTSGQIPSATPTAGEAPYTATAAQPNYRESVYRDQKIAPKTQSPPANTVPVADAYRSGSSSTAGVPAQSASTNAYAGTARTSTLSNSTTSVGATKETGPTRENTGKYYVEPGDSFWIIAQKVYGSGGFFKALQEHNRARFINPSDMQVGDEVLTPAEADLRERYSGLCPKIRVAKPGSPATQAATHQPVSHAAGLTKYEVQEGDTLYDIAKYELGDAQRWPEIFKLNRTALGVDIDYVKPGTMLVLPTDAPLEAQRSEDVLTRKPGDNLQR